MIEQEFINPIENKDNYYTDELSDEALDRAEASACCGFPASRCSVEPSV